MVDSNVKQGCRQFSKLGKRERRKRIHYPHRKEETGGPRGRAGGRETEIHEVRNGDSVSGWQADTGPFGGRKRGHDTRGRPASKNKGAERAGAGSSSLEGRGYGEDVVSSYPGS